MKWGILATGTIAKKFASTVEQMGAEGGSSLLPWAHGTWKAHRRLRSSTASPAALLRSPCRRSGGHPLPGGHQRL